MSPEESIINGWICVIKSIKQNSSPTFCLGHMEILFTVYLNDGIIRQDLSDRIKYVSPTSLKRYVKDMITEYGYITETVSDHDTRIKQLHISKKGQRLVEITVEKSKKCFTANSRPEG